MSKIKAGVIGVGQMGTYHAQIYRKLPQVELTALCEYKDERRKELETEFPGVRLYKDYREMLQDPEIEAVSIVLPDNMHREAVELAVAAKKHILLEKPLAKELEDGKAMYELVKDYDKVFTTGFLSGGLSQICHDQGTAGSGRIGRYYSLLREKKQSDHRPRRYIGASDLSMHVMIHDIDYVNWWMGCQPVKVFARNRSVLLKENGMNDVIYAIVTYENGAIACMEACWTLPENSPTIIDDKVELVATKGVAYVDSCDNGVRFVTGNGVQYPDSRHWYYVNGEVCGDLAEEVMAFVNNVANNTKSVITPKQSYDALRVVDAIERSIREGKEVEL